MPDSQAHRRLVVRTARFAVELAAMVAIIIGAKPAMKRLLDLKLPLVTPLVNSYRLPGRHLVLRREIYVYIASAAINDESKMSAISLMGAESSVARRQTVKLPVCTKILCVEANYSAVRIRVLSGPRTGQLWWLPMRLVQLPVAAFLRHHASTAALSLVETDPPGSHTNCGWPPGFSVAF
jgi:hypothetical protein